ncbi:MAG: CHAT domain-containing protein [Cyclobacteriaceae bacterium]|nr:CHAT domain-containing protein [Cyclobacteriaceae bacterium]
MRKYFTLLLLAGCIAQAKAQQSDLGLSEKIDNLIIDSQFQDAIDLIDGQSNLKPATFIFLQNKKAEALTRSGKLMEAQHVLNDIQTNLTKAPDSFLESVTQTNIGFLELTLGRNDLAEQSLLRAQLGFEKARQSTSLEAAQALANLGLVYLATGKYSQAEEQLQMTLSLRMAKLKSDHELIAATYNDLGLVYSQLDKDKALDYYENAQGIYSKIHGAEHPKIATTRINIGIIYLGLKLYGDAINNFDEALKIFNTVYTQSHPAKAIVLYNLGQTYLNMGDEKAAMGYYDRAFKMYEESFGFQHPEVANVLNAMGNLHLKQNNFVGALTSYQKALQANVFGFTNNNFSVNPPLKNYYNGLRLLQSLLFKAQAYEARYLSKSLRFEDLKSSLKVLLTCDSLIDRLRQQSNNESDKILLGATANEVYGDGVRIAHEAGLNAVKKKPYFELAFYFAEKSKGAVLLDAITSANAKSFAGIPDDLLEEEKNLKSSITLMAQKLAQKPSPEEERYVRETLFTLNRSYELFIQKMEKQFPEYFNLKFNDTSPTIPVIQKLLNPKTAVLSYFIDEKNNRLYIFQISNSSFKITDHTLSGDFDRYITGLRNGLYFNEMKTYKLSARELGRILIPNIHSSIQNLIILPTGRLGIIPFETLLTKNAEKITDYPSLPYLLNRFSVRYEFSAGLILQKSKEEKQVTSPSIFLCAPINFPEKDYLGDLPGTENEITEIAKLFDDKKLNHTSVSRKQADEKLVKSDQLSNYNILHFATHGVVDESDPELSRIFLQTDSDAEDGNLFAGEIYNLNLKANLVTLSACQTGMGKIFKGEGVIGLSRALVYAGAQNIIVSFWSVSDESTSVLMRDFYTRLLNQPTADFGSSLRSVKLDMLKKGPYTAPFYWAPFVLIGY